MGNWRVRAGGATTILAAAIGFALPANPAEAAPAVGDGNGGVELRSIGSFDQPTYVTSAPGRANHKLLFVVEKAGTVRIVRKGKTLKRPFLDISSKVTPDGEQGLLSIAFDPNYGKNRRFYAYYTDTNGDVQISGFQRTRKRKTVASGKEGKLLKVDEPFPNHNGGTLAFGPDEKLYIALGDGGAACDPTDQALDPSSLLGKLLRIQPKGRSGYKVPADNPFVGQRPRDEIYAYGLRNPYRFSFDQPTDSIAIGDVGQGAWEEIDIATLDQARGANFGWKVWEGNHRAGCGDSAFDADESEVTFPVHEYPHSGADHTGCSITGGVVVRDKRLKSLYGRYIYSDFCTGDLRSLLPPAEGGGDEKSVGLGLDSPVAFGVGRGNRIYAVSISGDVSVVRAAGKGKAGAASAGARDDADATAAANEAGPDAEAAIGDGRGGFKAESLGSFDRPVYVHGPAGANGLVFVVEQAGVIRMIDGGKKVGGKFLDIRKRVRDGGERGLLSVAFSPAYAKNRRFYVYYTDKQGDIVVAEYKRSRKNPRKADGSSYRKVIEIPHRFAANHNGGQLQFGPDRKLYIATGDGGGGGDPQGNAQNKSKLLGKILRIDPRRKRGKPYTAPADNPFAGKRPGAREIFSFGLRNPFRFSFDRARRAIVIGDVGQDQREEVDYETLRTARGANFGWNAFEGTRRFTGPAPKNHEKPIHQLSHSAGNCSITGGYVVRDKRLKSLFGRYIYADFCRGDIRSLIPKTSGARDDRSTKLANQSGISSFGEDARGRIYFSNLSGGTVYRLKPS